MKRSNTAWVMTLAVLVAVVGLSADWQPRSGHAVASGPAAPPPPTVAAPYFLGTASCSGRACHGGLGGAGEKSCEYPTFIQHDPHEKAFAVLREERSRVMVRNLLKKPDALPEKEHVCLQCHGPEVDAALRPQGAAFRPADGFGCESCHGPASLWKDEHTATDWRRRSTAEKVKQGFRPMDTMAERARVCASCHVGSGERDVYHDLYAAGHPRLTFAFETFLANVPRHWQPDKDKDLAAAWLVGQVVTAETTLDLLAYRAGTASRPWPEFAEYDCYACHHDLKADPARQKRGHGSGDNRRVPGTLPWNDWSYALPLALASPAQESLANDLLGLRKQMGQPLPDRTAVAKRAGALARQMDSWLARDRQPVRPAALVMKLLEGKESPLFVRDGKGNAVTVPNWDVAAQLAVALRAEYDTGPAAAPDPAVEKSLDALFQQLQFRAATKQTLALDSPARFDGAAFLKQLRETCKLLTAPASKEK